MRRYEIYWAELDPVEGSEMGKTRPVVIISLDALNDRVRNLTVCPLTTQLHPRWRTRLRVECGGQAAEIAVDHIRSLDKSRFGRKIDTLSADAAAALRELITELYGEP